MTEQSASDLDSLPRMSDVIGHKMMTQSGRLLGSIDDILIDGKDGTIIGFVVGEGVKSKLENMFSADRARSAGYVRADADLQVGNDLIVVPDDAFIEGDPEARGEENAMPPARTEDAAAQRPGWAGHKPLKAERRGIWTKRRATGGGTGGGDEVEGWIPGDFSQPSAEVRPPAVPETAAPAPPAESIPEAPRERTGSEIAADWTAPAIEAEPHRPPPVNPERLQ